MDLPDGWINSMLEQHKRTTSMRLYYDYENQTLHYETLDGWKNVVHETEMDCPRERWDEMVEMAKKPNRVDLLEDELFRL